MTRDVVSEVFCVYLQENFAGECVRSFLIYFDEAAAIEQQSKGRLIEAFEHDHEDWVGWQMQETSKGGR